MANDETYNGWANRETWLVNLWFGDYFTQTAEETGCAFSAEEVEEFVKETVYFQLGENISSGFIADIMGGSLARIDWQEISEHTEVLV
jgi:hypothetical protein